MGLVMCRLLLVQQCILFQALCLGVCSGFARLRMMRTDWVQKWVAPELAPSH